jgi:hypothetical protein
MKTDQLTAVLAADTIRTRPVAVTLALALAAGMGVAALVALPVLGLRSDLASAVGEGPVIVKHLATVVLTLAAFGATQRLARPGQTIGIWGLLFTVVAGLLMLAALGAMMATPRESWGAAMRGQTGWICVPLIVAMSAPLLAATLWALGDGASTRPGFTGALAGLLSASAAAALYALHCPEDSPLYYLVWYGIALFALSVAGALLGRHQLRW